MLIATMSIEDVNSLISEHFIKIFGNVVEHCPAAAIGILKKRPFENAQDVSTAVDQYLDALGTNEKRQVLKSQTNLLEKLSNLDKIFSDSNEQREKIGLNAMTTEQRSMLHNLNEEYKNKYGLPFVLCIINVTIPYILAALTERLENDLEEEVDVGIEEVKKICKFRISQIVKENSETS